MTFTHGDFRPRQILVDDWDHVSWILDWQCAGWYPEYWEFTTPRTRLGDKWWDRVLEHLSRQLENKDYTELVGPDKALEDMASHAFRFW